MQFLIQSARQSGCFADATCTGKADVTNKLAIPPTKLPIMDLLDCSGVTVVVAISVSAVAEERAILVVTNDCCCCCDEGRSAIVPVRRENATIAVNRNIVT